MSRTGRCVVVLVAVASLGAGALLSACGSDPAPAPSVELSAAGTRGKVVAKEQGCISCHGIDGEGGTGPTWEDLAGSKVKLEDGSTVLADDAYLRTAILQSRGQVVKGYANVMPVYEGEMTNAELADLMAYLHDLAPAAGSTATSAASRSSTTTTSGG